MPAAVQPFSTPSAPTVFVRLPNWVGDVCMSLPSLTLLAQSRCRLILCAKPWAEELLAGYRAAHAVQEFVPLSGTVWQDRQTVAAAVAAMRTPTLAAGGMGTDSGTLRGLLLPDSLSSALVFRLAGLPCAGYRDDGRSVLLRWPVSKPAPATTPHAVQSWHYLTRTALARWHMPILEPALATHRSQLSNRPADLPLTEHQVREAQQTLAAAGLHAQRFILIAPTATGLHQGRVKVWPGFRALTQQLQAACPDLPVVMCPPAAEVAQARATVPQAQILPPLPLGAFAALTRMARLVICNDSGVSHLAAAVQAAQLTLFGVTQPTRTGPWSARAQCLGTMGAWPDVDTVRAAVLRSVQNKLPPDA